MSFNYSPKITTEGLVFYIDPFNFKSRNKSVGLTGGTIIDLTSSYDFAGTFTNEPEVSNDYKYITFDGTDDFILFPYSSAESFQEQMPFYRYKPKTFTFSSWVKSGTTGGGGVMFFGGGNDFFLKIPALTATTSYSAGTYTGVIGENWSATTPTEASKNLPSFEVTIGSGGTITKAVAETINPIGGGSAPDNELVIVKLSGDTIGGNTPADDAYLLWRSGTSSLMRWGFLIGNNYGMTVSDSINKGTFTTDRVSNEPKEWNAPLGHTTHLTTADKSGLVISLTQTIGPLMGSKVAAKDLGFLYAVTMGGYLGDYKPGDRANSHISPTMLFNQNDELILALGAAGGSRIVTAVVQATNRYIDQGKSLTEAISQGRVYSQNDTILIENHQGIKWTKETFQELEKNNIPYKLQKEMGYHGRINAIALDTINNRWISVTDPDWEGKAIDN